MRPRSLCSEDFVEASATSRISLLASSGLRDPERGGYPSQIRFDLTRLVFDSDDTVSATEYLVVINFASEEFLGLLAQDCSLGSAQFAQRACGQVGHPSEASAQRLGPWH